MQESQGLDKLFNPSSIAVIGASKNEQWGGGLLLRSLINNGFQGKLYPVNPRESELTGLRCYPTVLDIPVEVDLAILTVPARTVPQGKPGLNNSEEMYYLGRFLLSLYSMFNG